MSVPAPAFAERVVCSELEQEEVRQTDATNQPFADLEVPAAQAEGTGDGVKVALIDSGVFGELGSSRWLPRLKSSRVAGAPAPEAPDDFAALVAGLIGGSTGEGRTIPLGVAPGAEIFSVQVYDGPLAGEDAQALTADNLARGIDEAVSAGAKVIDVSPASFAGSAALRASVARAIRKQVVVVAAIGERPQEEGQPGFREYGAYEADENVLTFPAAYPGVLGVGIGTAEGSFNSEFDVASDAIDVVAPVSEAVSTTQNGSTCVIDRATTSLAAGEVSGLAALLVAKYPDYNPAQISAVIMETANGTIADRSPVAGAGTIQANEAMTRQLKVEPDGTVVQAQQQLDQTPPVPPAGPDDNPFPGMRRSLLWWGVLAGGGLLLALLVRPLLRR